jgi:hypothetical protein
MAQLFTKQKKKEVSPIEHHAVQMNRDVITLSSRVRIAEERYGDLRKKLQLIEQNMLMFQKKIVMDNKLLERELGDAKHTIHELRSKMMLLVKELQFLAKKEDVEYIKKYVGYWNPIKFVTVNQVEKMIDEKLSE